jgi:hypothetical protein
MNQHDVLTVITFGGLVVSFVAALVSQLWKGSVDVEGQIRKRLTPAGYLSLGISMVGLLASISSELIRISIKHSEQLQAQAAAAQERALRAQETRWRDEMQKLLSVARDDIEKNLDRTIHGFQESQQRFAETQANIVASKQEVLENNLRRTNEIIVAVQPLTSLSLTWESTSTSAGLRQAITKGEQLAQANAETSQGGTPEVPFEEVDYTEKLLPLLSYIARLVDDGGQKDDDDDAVTSAGLKKAIDKGSIAVLVPLDEANNTVLSFGDIQSGVPWSGEDKSPAVAAGFWRVQGARKISKTPQVTARFASDESNISSYKINWVLDPADLPKAIDKKNRFIASTAKLPRKLRIAILYDVKFWPFPKNDFADPHARLWADNEDQLQEIAVGRDKLAGMSISMTVNGMSELEYRYRLSKLYRLTVMDDFDDELELKCTVLEFDPG